MASPKVEALGELKLGQRIRARRRELGMPLSQLAEMAGTTIGALSQIERGRFNPSLKTLRTIARSLDVSLFRLFFEDGEQGTAFVSRSGKRRTLHTPDSTLTYELMTPLSKASMEALYVRMAAGQMSFPEMNSHAGDEFVMAVRGQIRIDVLDNSYYLNEGDSIYFNGERPHRYVNEGKREAELLVVVTPAGWR